MTEGKEPMFVSDSGCVPFLLLVLLVVRNLQKKTLNVVFFG